MTAPRPAPLSLLLGALALVFVATVMGGASRENPLRLGVVEIIALPLALLGAHAWTRRPPSRSGGAALLILVGVVALPLLQLAPWPPALWTRFPGRAPVMEVIGLAHLPLSWRPLTLAPGQTLDAAIALLPPFAMFLAATKLGAGDRRSVIALWASLGVCGVILGVFQLASQNGGPAYLYETTNLGSLVGFFANRNHEASFLLAMLPLAAAGAIGSAGTATTELKRGASAIFFVLAIVGIGAVRSRAGILLLAPALVGVAAMLWRSRRPGASRREFVLLGAGAIAVAGVLLFGLTPIAHRFDKAAPAEFRFEAWPAVESLARSYLPTGSGVGSFDRIYRAAEPLQLVGPKFFNHAHNDFLEMWLETGLAGAALLAVFLAWFALAAAKVWRDPSPSARLAQAASVSLLVMLAHSWVDYPLRTETMAVLFAFCCALIAEPGFPSRWSGPKTKRGGEGG